MTFPVRPQWGRFSHTGGNEKIANRKKERLQWESDRDKKFPGEFSSAVKHFTLCLNFGRNVVEVSSTLRLSPPLREISDETIAGMWQFETELDGIERVTAATCEATWVGERRERLQQQPYVIISSVFPTVGTSALRTLKQTAVQSSGNSADSVPKLVRRRFSTSQLFFVLCYFFGMCVCVLALHGVWPGSGWIPVRITNRIMILRCSGSLCTNKQLNN